MILLVIYLAVFVTLIKGQVDPCLESEHTLRIDDYRRSVNYTVHSFVHGHDVPLVTEERICDRYLDEGWYRFESRAGNEMPTYPVPILRCATEFPIWLNGDHPSVADGEVNMKACKTSFSGDCVAEYDIKVKNCVDFYVYYLIPTDGCAEAYCIGTEVQCPIGQSSNNGFTPGCVRDGFPEFYKTPTIGYSVETINGMQQEVVMECGIEHNETDINVDVFWYMDETLVHEQVGQNALKLVDFPAKLHERDWFGKATLDTNLRCVLRPRFNENAIPGPEVEASYYMGMVVIDTTFTVEEGGQPAMFRFYPTIPILCRIPGCKLNIELHEPRINDSAATCAAGGHSPGQVAVQFETSDCRIAVSSMTQPSASTLIEFPLYAGIDGLYDNDVYVNLVLRTVASHAHHPIWQNYKFPTAQVRVVERDAKVGANVHCKAYNDPHMLTFDGRPYELQREGEFVLYRHKTLPIEVQVYFGSTSGFYTKVCGAAVRSGGDLWVYDFCRPNQAHRIRAYECEDMSLKIVEFGNGYKVYLPTGAHVVVTSGYIGIYPSLSDIGETVGLCGSFDYPKNCGNDFIKRDGSIVPDSECSDCRGSCRRQGEDPFSEDWRVQADESLYEGNIRAQHPFDQHYFCSCTEDENTTDNKAICSKHASLDYCVNGNDITEGMFKWCTDLKLRRRRRRDADEVDTMNDDVEEEVVRPDWDVTFVAPEAEWRGNWTESSATAYCSNFFNDNTQLQACLENVNMDVSSVIEICVTDIKITSDVHFSRTHLSSLLGSCLYEFGRNNSKFTFNNDTGALDPPEELGKICEDDCNGRGQCMEGVCRCDAGFSGDQCNVDDNQVLTLFDLQFDGLCDLEARPCASTPVYGDYFADKSTLSCKMTPTILTKSGERIPQETVITSGQFSHSQRIMCPVPVVSVDYEETDYFTVGFDISASNNGEEYSNVKQLTVFNSKCMNCDSDLHCTQNANTCAFAGLCYNKDEPLDTQQPCYICNGEDQFEIQTGSCFIDSRCHHNDTRKLNDDCYYCNPEVSRTTWTSDTTDSCAASSSSSDSSNTGVIVGSVLLLVAVVLGGTDVKLFG